jgi:hypothetical protein
MSFFSYYLFLVYFVSVVCFVCCLLIVNCVCNCFLVIFDKVAETFLKMVKRLWFMYCLQADGV